MKANQTKQAVCRSPQSGISKAGVEARRAYQRKYYAEHKEQHKRYQNAYWERVGNSNTDREEVAED